MEGLNIGILQKIFAEQAIPKKIEEWYEQASRIDANYQRVREVLVRGGTSTAINQAKRAFTP